MTDPRTDFIESVLLNESSLLPFDGFIFLCGGKVDASQNLPASVRDALRREIAKHEHLESRVRLAEDYKDWSFDSFYTDLLEFESHIAQLSAAIVLMLEAPGALAELGLFSALGHFQSKLIVFVSNHHYAESSFIRLGPIKFLEDTLGNAAECFPWVRVEFGRETTDREQLAPLQPELLQALEDRLKPVAGDQRIELDNWLHQALVICELVGIMSALTVTEIREYLRALGVQKTLGQVRKTLFILEKMRMVTVVARSNQRFYVSTEDREFVRWKSKSGAVDKGKSRFNIIEFYGAADKKRFLALQQVRGAL
jgi:DNA-binding transcriptional ArsR family regulator